MRKVFLFASALMLSLSFTSCERIDAGCEGILVNLYGSERGVDDVSMVTGRVFYNPATQEVYEYPKTIVEAKNRAIQLAQKAANEVQVAEAEAKKKIVVAEAEAKANAIVNASLTPLLVKKQWIEKWSGESPKVVGAGSSVLIGLNDLK